MAVQPGSRRLWFLVGGAVLGSMTIAVLGTVRADSSASRVVPKAVSRAVSKVAKISSGRSSREKASREESSREESSRGVPEIDVERVLSRAHGLDPKLLALGLSEYAAARESGSARREILAIIDFRRRSVEERLWVIDLAHSEVLLTELVAHGKNTGEDLAVAFSNRPKSNQSSLGTFVGGDTYIGQHGQSLRLIGLDPGLNDNAESRAIVIHGAEYATRAFAEKHGRLGRSFGCPAVRPEIAPELIDALEGGGVLFAYYPDPALERRLAAR